MSTTLSKSKQRRLAIQSGCTLPDCQLKVPHTGYVTDFCHYCGSSDIKLVLETFWHCNECGWSSNRGMKK